MIVARKFIVRGQVQGVGFRFFTQRAAARHQVSGYVKNLPDGAVESLAQGNETAVEGFKHDITAGPIHAEVREIEELVIEPNNFYSSFRIEK